MSDCVQTQNKHTGAVSIVLDRRARFSNISIVNFFRSISMRTVPRRVFISYGNEARESAHFIYETLRQNGFDPWMDDAGLRPGVEWEKQILAEMRQSDFIILCYSNQSGMQPGFRHREISLALDLLDYQPEGRVYLIPVRLDDCELPSGLQHLQYVDVFGPNMQAGMERLVDSLHAGLVQRGWGWFRAEVLTGPDRGKKFVVDANPVGIGRNGSNHVCLSDKKVASNQALVEIRRNRVVLKNLSDSVTVIVKGAKHGMKLSCERTMACFPDDGDIVKIGETTLQLRFNNIELVKNIETTEL